MWSIHLPQIHKSSFTNTGAIIPDSKVHGANMGPTWVLSAPDGPHVGPMNIAIMDVNHMIGYRKTSNIRRTLVGNKIVNHSDVVGASSVGAALTTSSFST